MLRGYWKFNNSLLKDASFNDSIKNLLSDIFSKKTEDSYKVKWEFFKYKARQIAIRRSKDLKASKNKNIYELLNKINILLQKKTNSGRRIGFKGVKFSN